MRKSGFSLVELSIVLVILGLLVGGILAGQSLIRAAEIRAVTSDLSKYASAHYAFRDKYFALPGDMNNAVAFWGAADGSTGETTACLTTDSLTLSDTKRTCNGDGNGRIETTGTTDEIRRYWQHLANAGMIEGTYAGIVGTSGGNLPGYNSPISRLSKLALSIGWLPNASNGYASGATYDFDGFYGNTFAVQGPRNNSLTPPQERLLRPGEFWNIDTKLDDGKPHIGKIRVRKAFGCTVDDGTSNPDYALSVNDIVCNGYHNL